MEIFFGVIIVLSLLMAAGAALTNPAVWLFIGIALIALRLAPIKKFASRQPRQ